MLGMQAAAQSSICSAPDQLVDVQLSGSARGTLILHTDGSDYWVEPDAFLPSEAEYVSERVTCPALTLVKIRPELHPVFNQSTLTLALQAAPSLLRGQKISTKAVETNSLLKPQSLFSVNYATSGRIGAGPAWADANLNVGYVGGAWRGGAGISSRWDSMNDRTFTPYAAMTYETGNAQVESGSAGRSWQLTAQYNLPSDLRPTWRSFSGIRATTATPYQNFWPQFQVTLPLAANYVLRVDGQTIQSGSADPGPLTFTNVPLRHTRGMITLEITDAQGTHYETQPYSFPSHLMAVHAFEATLEAGWVQGQGAGAGSAAFGVNPFLTLQGRASLTQAEQQFEFWAVTAPANSELYLGVTGLRQQENWSTTGHALFRKTIKNINLGLQADIPLAAPSRAAVKGSVTYTTPRYDLSGDLSYDLGTHAWQAVAQAGARINQQLNVRTQGVVRQNGWGVGVNLTYQPTENIKIRSSNAWSPNLGQVNTLGLEYKVNPASTIRATTDLHSAQLEYGYTERFAAQLGLSSQRQAYGFVQGSLIFTGGQVIASQSQPEVNYLLINTGLTGIPLYLDGIYQGKTNAKGHLIVATDARNGVRLSTRPNELPIEVNVKSEKLDITTSSPGSYAVDWTGNFTQMRWNQLRWPDGQPAADSNVTFGLESYPTDSDGFVFIPASFIGKTVTVTSMDGKMTCQAPITQAEQAKCNTVP